MRLAGAILVFTAFLWAGAAMCRGKKSRFWALEQLCYSLELAVSELGARNSPLPELMSLLSRRSAGAAGLFYGEVCALLSRLGELEFSDMWTQAAKECLSALEPAELEAVEELGFILGRYTLSDQVSAIKHSLSFLRGQRDAARENYPRDRKLSLGLCAALGALLAIVCI